ncbi:CPBP family intramembrane glutamic endopeptidase [Promethearchaeum syntrophicum]|uniref:CPBP family intramembrane glutamic endopeptidase n=1 Tax=Promethearchaeum syntrophicum TaxID=2594042 RepID=A0A5B9DD96_9ARCH|nr:type II CAAX endopeptidase family protein [Candidatus Prometheoarchaeum syntrophicum]QEE16847.1 CAAX amino terminal protease self- immunity [Candidatus Prometheoarchaeum syntrophicum]
MAQIKKIFYFFLFTYCWSWSFWGLTILLKGSLATWYFFLLYALGGIAPSAVGIILSFQEENLDRTEYWRRFTDIKRFSWIWGLIAFFGPIVIVCIAILLDIVFFGYTTQFDNIIGVFLEPLGLFTILGFGIVAILIEEFGWRAFALPKLLQSTTPFVSSSILGLLWACWHIPLFFISGTYQNGLGLFTPDFYIYLSQAFLFTFLITYLFKKTKYSLISAMIAHFANNIAGELFGPSPRIALIRTILFLVLSILIVISWSGEGKNVPKKE